VRTLAIGDIHGCNTALLRLLAEVQPMPEDTLIFLGDYIDRGPASRQVIETLLGLRGRCKPIFLRGNHEVMLLEARFDPLKAHLWQGYGGIEMLASYDADRPKNWIASIPGSHWYFFAHSQPFF
jgi:serine/threonine protein phosphatase 1